jgi:hypothetical protein
VSEVTRRRLLAGSGAVAGAGRLALMFATALFVNV